MVNAIITESNSVILCSTCFWSRNLNYLNLLEDSYRPANEFQRQNSQEQLKADNRELHNSNTDLFYKL